MLDTYEPRNTQSGRSPEEFVPFFVDYCRRHLFVTKKQMADELGIGYQTIILVTNTPGKYKNASRVFQELVVYCITNAISMDEIAKAFYDGKDGHGEAEKYVLREFGIRCTTCFFESSEGDAVQTRAYRFMLQVQSICCEGCLLAWCNDGTPGCLIMQTAELVMGRFASR